MKGKVGKIVPVSKVLEHPAASPATARRHFTAKLAVETDAWDVHADMQKGSPGFIVVDTRRAEAFAEEHVRGAINMHYRAIDAGTVRVLPKSKLIVVYCSGPGCNAAAKGAARLAALGYRVKEMIGGLEWWKKDGFPTERMS